MLWVAKYDIRLAFHEIFNNNPKAIILKNTIFNTRTYSGLKKNYVKKTRRGALLLGETVQPPPWAFVKLLNIKAIMLPNENSSCCSSFNP